jgi:hypothetical protein
MIISREELVPFLRTVCMTGHALIQDAVFDCNEQGLRILVKTMCNGVVAEGLLDRSAFADYQAWGEIGVDNLPRLIKSLLWMNDIIRIELDSEKSHFILYSRTNEENATETRMSTFSLRNIETMPNAMNIPYKYPLTNTPNVTEASFSLHISVFKQFMSNLSLVGADVMHLITEERGIKFHAETNDKIVELIPLMGITKDVMFTFGESAIDALTAIDGNISMTIFNQMVTQLENINKHYRVRMIIAHATPSSMQQ